MTDDEPLGGRSIQETATPRHPLTVFSGVHPVTVDEIGKEATVSLYFSSPTWSVVQPGRQPEALL